MKLNISRTVIFSLLVGVGFFGCASQKRNPSDLGHSKMLAASAKKNMGPSIPVLHSVQLASLPPGSSGPYLSTNKDGALAVWAVPAKTEQRWTWHAQALSLNGTLIGKEHALVESANDLLSVTVRPLGGKNFVLLWSRGSANGTILEALAMDGSGKALSKPQVVVEEAPPVLWAEAVPTPSGAHIYIATGQSADAQLFVTAINSKAERASAPRLVSARARAWDAVSNGKGSMLTAIVPKGKEEQVVAWPITSDGKPANSPTLIAGNLTTEHELDATSVGDQVVIAWAQQQGRSNKVFLTKLDSSGKVIQQPQAPLVSIGEQSLVHLLSGGNSSKNLLMVWHDLSARTAPGKGRLFNLTALKSDLKTIKAESEMLMGSDDDDVPAMVGYGKGFASLTIAPACTRQTPSCKQAPLLPTYGIFDESGILLANGPLLPDVLKGQAPSLAWGLTCSSESCFALSTDSSEPIHVFSTSFEPASEHWAPLTVAKSLRGVHRIESVSDMIGKYRFADMATLKLGENSVIVTLSDHLPGGPVAELPSDVNKRTELEKDRAAKRGQGSPRAAILQVHLFDKKGKLIKEQTISIRATATAGISLAPSANGKEFVVGWVAPDRKTPQLFLTRFAADGKKLGQTMFTQGKEAVSESVLTPISTGWMVSWIANSNQVLSGKLGERLQRTVPKQVLATSKGEISALSATALTSKDALVVYSDSAEHAKQGIGNSMVVGVDLAQAKAKGSPELLHKSELHSLSTRIVPFGKGAVVSWLEQNPAGNASSPSSLVVAELDEQGKIKTEAKALDLPGHDHITSLDMRCDSQVCRFAATYAHQESSVLFEFKWSPAGSPPKPTDLLRLMARGEVDVLPTLLDRDIVLIDDARLVGATSEIRRVRLKSQSMAAGQ
jgi:hypothetical protein